MTNTFQLVQVAGHRQLVLDNSGNIVKHTTRDELAMYQWFQKDITLRELAAWVPRCVAINQAEGILVLENLCGTMRAPNVADIKVGRIQSTPSMSPEKLAYLKTKEQQTTSASLALRLCGMLTQGPLGNAHASDKHYGRSLSSEGLTNAIRNFFPDPACREAARDQIQGILRAVSIDGVLERYTFVSASILLVFDHTLCVEATRRSVCARLIDFAHSGPALELTDHHVGFHAGLENLVRILS